ncbi:MAG TPA: 50S ribosomal protein L7/L12 [Candidatus Latescibacteria bacterium]|jgi:large subunit ribosomal protein L7/L12|nr:50S ribosomal protein L7/L12 [Candidatus Latescibacterota bacterium]HOF60930.1 50S ribosomal protein L7/L12 [Candidatus Latescibacterota bacterium]HOS64680.1 50S ribosomal protein L7/L12 [Candidatus Latescibacterota bacterium]HOT36570.1 50S ribosomal protein L7/L12 [Candidatus Latescibacterota bacterium]HPC44503.1 50S ribosomal protein L7/L12 [Candidatus Latescibacterota bacterium]
MADLQALKTQLSALTVLEIAQLTKELEAEWGVSAAAPVAVAAAPAAGGAAAAAPVEEQTEFTPTLVDVGSQKIQVIKVVRELTGLGLKEAKALVDAGTAPVKEGVSKEEANTIKEKLEAVGAKVEIK